MKFFSLFVGTDVLYGNSCYTFIQSGKTWKENRETCKEKGGDLISMETEGEWKFILEEIKKRCHISTWYIGFEKIKKDWKWLNGRPLTYSGWRENQPSGDGDVATMARNNGLFNDIRRELSSPFICEMPKGKTIQQAINQTGHES